MNYFKTLISKYYHYLELANMMTPLSIITAPIAMPTIKKILYL